MGQEWAQNGLKTHKNAHPNERIQDEKMKKLPQITWTEKLYFGNLSQFSEVKVI